LLKININTNTPVGAILRSTAPAGRVFPEIPRRRRPISKADGRGAPDTEIAMDRRRQTALRPAVAALEGRELPSGIIAALASDSHRTPSNAQIAAANAAAQAAVSVPSADFPPGTVTQTNGLPVVFTFQGTQPTPFEQARQVFHAVFGGTFITGAPLYSDQSSRTVITATGSTSASLHSSLQLLLVTYPPGQGPASSVSYGTSQPIQGMATVTDKNLNTSGSLLVDLSGDRSALDSGGRPTQVTYIGNPFSGVLGTGAGGIFAPSINAGTVTLKYHPSGRTRPGVTSEGTVTVLFRGLLFNSGTTLPIGVTGLQASHRKSRL
jgi:hypothetical protein